MDFNKTPKYVMYYLFPVDSILRDKKAKVKALDRHGLCLPKNNDELVGRMLPLFRHIPPEEIVKDLIEMKLNGLACVGMDGTCLSVDEIRSKRYGELIRNCRKSRIMFIHAFPFADTYDNALTGKYPHIKQKDHQGKHPFVGWDKENSHFNIDYGSDEFITFCKESIAAVKELGCKVIDYGEPDHYPYSDNGYGESLARAYKKETGGDPPFPTTLEHRKFMEERNLRGLNAINKYVKSMGMSDHLTASPLIHGGIWICQNYGKYSKTNIDELSTTFHDTFGFAVAGYMKENTDMIVSPLRTQNVGCVESKSMRGWDERHAVYFGAGGGYPFEQFKESLPAAVILHQMDLFLWDYTNFKNSSMYCFNRFEDVRKKYMDFKKLVRTTIDVYMKLPRDYREAVPDPDAMVFYSKDSDYLYEMNREFHKGALNGVFSLYSTALKLQQSDVPFMVAFDEYPEVLAKDGKDTPLLIMDGCQRLSREFADGIFKWFGKGKAVVFFTPVELENIKVFEKLAEKAGQAREIKLVEINKFRRVEYAQSEASIKLDGWNELVRVNTKPVAWVKGNEKQGMLVYTSVPISGFHMSDMQRICQEVLNLLGKRRNVIEGNMVREVVKYKNGRKKYLAIKNHGNMTENITINTHEKPNGFYPRRNDVFVAGRYGKYALEINFKPGEIRIIEYLNQ